MNYEKVFEAASYRGTFRDYQRHLLKNLEERLDDSKLNIVTPSGSGKVVLGLELIRRMGAPCLIISSTEVMRTHWAEHFVTQFLPDGEQENRETYLSYDLMHPALLTSITYEALYRAVKKAAISVGGQKSDIVDIDIIRLVQECGIRTVLLDEPHHLPGHCMDALESFLGVLGGEFRVITLTGNPPYDLHSDEWERYENLCGETTEEIHIPELVKGHALCPHQDYVYFNYPSEEESSGIAGYRLRVDLAVAEAATLPFMGELNRRISRLYNRKKTDFLYSHHEAVVGVLSLLHEYGHKVDMGVYKHLTGHNLVAPLTADMAQHAINFLLESQTVLRDGEKEQLIEVFTRQRLMEHGRVLLVLTPKVRRTLMASVGKLDSIATITASEGQSMGDSLREIVLTDSATSAELQTFGENQRPDHVGVVAVCETLLRQCPHIPVGGLSEDCAILPASAYSILREQYGLSAELVSVQGIDATTYALYRFADRTTQMMQVARLFKDGHICVLVGSADVLGEGWDDTFVNTLVVASFDSSFVEINRMRGRVIHADKEIRNKTAHVWHLVTLEHAYSDKENTSLRLASRLTADTDGGLAADYKYLARCFECYMGPNVTTGELENGMDRLGLKLSPGENSMTEVNSAMLEASRDREKVRRMWEEALTENTRPISEVRVPRAAKVPVFTPANTLLLLAALGGLFGGIAAAVFLTFAALRYVLFNPTIVAAVLVAIIVMLVMALTVIVTAVVYILYFLPLPINHIHHACSIHSLCRNLLRTLKDIGAVNKEAEMVMEPLPNKKEGYRLYLDNCTHDEQICFQKAVTEMLSPIRNPRYVLVRGGWFRRLLWRWSFACPTIIAKNDVFVKVFEKYIRRSMGSMKFQYTRRDPGRKYLIFARNRSYLNNRNKPCEKRIHLLKHERTL